MRTRTALIVFLVLLGSGGTAGADPYTVLPNGDVVFNAVLTTRGVFTCLSSMPCSGSGTSTITLASGEETATLSFAGVNNMALQIGNKAQPVNLGTIQSSATEGFRFPNSTHPNRPLLRFNFSMTHDSPVAGTVTRAWGFGPGGNTSLPVFTTFGGGQYAVFSAGANPPGANYDALIYTFSPFPFSIPSNGSVNIGANVGAVPEPASLLLLGTGLAYGAYARRRKRR